MLEIILYSHALLILLLMDSVNNFLISSKLIVNMSTFIQTLSIILYLIIDSA